MSFGFGNNGYGGYAPRYPSAVPQQPFMPQPMGQPMGQPMPQPMAQRPISELPIVNVLFASEDEAKSYLPQPNTRVLFINKQKNEAYIKSADSVGVTYLETFAFAPKTEETAKKEETPTPIINTDAFLTKEMGARFAEKDELKEFITKGDLDACVAKLSKKIEDLTKKIKLIATED